MVLVERKLGLMVLMVPMVLEQLVVEVRGQLVVEVLVLELAIVELAMIIVRHLVVVEELVVLVRLDHSSTLVYGLVELELVLLVLLVQIEVVVGIVAVERFVHSKPLEWD